MPVAGVEPARYRYQRILSPPRLPIPTYRRNLYYSTSVSKFQVVYENFYPIYTAYRKSGYSKKYHTEHESNILLHKAAKKAFDELGVTKLPTVKSLQAEYADLLAKKKAAYAEYRTAREEIKELLLHKSNIDRMLERKQVTHDEKMKKHERR